MVTLMHVGLYCSTSSALRVSGREWGKQLHASLAEALQYFDVFDGGSSHEPALLLLKMAIEDVVT